MKFLTLLIAFICFSGIIIAQDSIVEVRYLVQQDWSKKMLSLDYLSKQQKEKQSYVWGSRSTYKSYSILYLNGNKTKFIDSEEGPEPSDYRYSSKKELYEIQSDFDKATRKYYLKFNGKNTLVDDSLQCQTWKIKNDLKEVAGHLCMNATWRDTLLKKTVDVWFALDIPTSAGPEYFCGLPGLILELDMNNGAMVYTANRIQKIMPDANFTASKKIKAKTISNSHYQKMLTDFIKEKQAAEQPYFWEIRY